MTDATAPIADSPANSSPNAPLAIVLLSGGLDSMVCAALAKQKGYRIAALTIDYNQRHRIELQAARNIADHIGVERHLILPLDLRKMGGSALTDDGINVPQSGLSDGIPVTYVPARNLIFLSLLLGWAEILGAKDLFIGVNALDYSGYPDCRPEFITGFEHLARLATKAADAPKDSQGYKIHAPLQEMRKADIAHIAYQLGLDPAMSWSCYNPTIDQRPCGLCDSCLLRKQGFADAGLADRDDYAA